MSPSQAQLFFRTLPSRDRLGPRADFPRKEERKRGNLAATPGMLERKEEHTVGLERPFS